MEYIAPYLSLILILIMNFYFLYFKEYSKEKGKNIATKEDIEEITAKIESVKLELTHSFSKKSLLLENHKLALINFLEEYNIWYGYSIKEISVVDNIFNLDQIQNKINEIVQQRNLVEKSYWKLGIFEAEDRNFANFLQNLFSDTDKLSWLTIDFLLSMEQSTLKIIQTRLTKDLATERAEIKNKFIREKEVLEKNTINFPNLLAKYVREKYLKLFDTQS